MQQNSDKLQITIEKREPENDYVVWPKNLREEYRGVKGEGDTPSEAVEDFFNSMMTDRVFGKMTLPRLY